MHLREGGTGISDFQEYGCALVAPLLALHAYIST